MKSITLLFKKLFLVVTLGIITSSLWGQTTLQICNPTPPTTSHTWGDYITKVTFAGINNTIASPYNTAFRTIYPSSSFLGQVNPGATYPISITTEGDITYQYVAVFIDWDQSGNFGTCGNNGTGLTANEQCITWSQSTTVGSSRTITGNITVPAGAALGKTYMRVLLSGDETSNPESFELYMSFGEIQEYVINVSAATSAPTVTTVTASSVTSAGATLNGTVNANNASTTVSFDYGTTTAYGSSVSATPSPVIGNSATAISAALTGLVPNTTYYYRVVGVNSAGTTNGSQLTFTTTAIAPTVTTVAASGVASTSATLNGTVNANNASTAVTFEYGTTTAYGTTATAAQSPVTGTSATSVTYALTGLVPNTTYYYRVVGVNSAGTTNGSQLTFTTAAIVPTVTTVAASSVTSTGATLNGTVNANNASTTVTFEYGTTTAYGTTVTAAQSPVTGTSATSVTYALTNLVPNTTYYYRVKGVNTGGTTNGSQLSFTTAAIVPTVTTVAASSVTSTGATLNGTVNANNATSVVTFEYGTTTSYGTSVTVSQSPATGTSAISVSYLLSTLTANTTYHYRVKAVNSAGTSNGGDATFTTLPVVPTVTTQYVSSISTTTATGNGNITSLGTPNPTAYGVCWNTTGTPTVSDSKVNNGSTSATGAFTAAMTLLSANTTYYVRAYATNTAGTSYGSEVSFTTSILTEVEQLGMFEIKLYPNPCTNGFTIDAGSENVAVKIYTLSGNLIFSQQINGSGFLKTESLSAGIYVVKINGKNFKLVKK